MLELAPAIVRDEFSLGTVQRPRLAHSSCTYQGLLDACSMSANACQYLGRVEHPGHGPRYGRCHWSPTHYPLRYLHNWEITCASKTEGAGLLAANLGALGCQRHQSLDLSHFFARPCACQLGPWSLHGTQRHVQTLLFSAASSIHCVVFSALMPTTAPVGVFLQTPVSRYLVPVCAGAGRVF